MRPKPLCVRLVSTSDRHMQNSWFGDYPRSAFHDWPISYDFGSRELSDKPRRRWRGSSNTSNGYSKRTAGWGLTGGCRADFFRRLSVHDEPIVCQDRGLIAQRLIQQTDILRVRDRSADDVNGSFADQRVHLVATYHSGTLQVVQHLPTVGRRSNRSIYSKSVIYTRIIILNHSTIIKTVILGQNLYFRPNLNLKCI